MHDKQIEELMTGYADSLGHFERSIPVRKTLVWKPAMVAALGSAVVAAFVFLPRKAVAAPMENVATALGKASYWRSDNRMKQIGFGNGQWLHHSSRTFWNGIFQFDSAYNSEMELRQIVDKGTSYDDFRKTPYILKSRLDRELPTGFEDPLKNALAFTRRSSEKCKRKDGLRYEGVEAYALSFADKTKRTIFEAIVRKVDDLPLKVTTEIGNGKYRYLYESEYRYTPPVGKTGIAIDSTKVMIDVDRERAAVHDRWSQIPVTNSNPTIYDCSVSKDGSIWIAYAINKSRDKDWSPRPLFTSPYALNTSYELNAYRSGDKFKVNGQEVLVTKFVPVKNSLPQPDSLDVEFSRFRADKSTEKKMLNIQLRHEAWDFPTYFPAFFGQVDRQAVDASRYWSIGVWNEEHQHYAEAATAFEESIQASYLRGMKIPSLMTLEMAARCYEKAGNSAKAKALRQQAVRIKRAKL